MTSGLALISSGFPSAIFLPKLIAAMCLLDKQDGNAFPPFHVSVILPPPFVISGFLLGPLQLLTHGIGGRVFL
jgi:uncharacterized membrane protein